MRLVPIECVREGYLLGKTLFDDAGRVLLRDGVMLSSNLIRRIKQSGIFSIYITDDYSEHEIEDIIKPELRQKSIKILKDTFSSMEKYLSNTATPKNSTDMIKTREAYFASIKQIGEELLEELLGQKNIMINLVDIKSMDNYTYQHCVNVAVLSLVIGTQLQINRSELLELCIGALLHDIGKIFVPFEILNKPEALTPEEFEIIKSHTNKGYDFLLGSYSVSAQSRIIILQHHEKVNGTGYPESRTGDKISKLSKIVAIADVYDALTSDRPYRRAMSPNEALEYIFAFAGTHFDYEIAKSFTSIIVPYPNGTLVQLNSGDIGVVEEVNPYCPLRPKIKIIKSLNESHLNNSVDLMKKLDIVVQDIVYNI